jgi:hypothetical protein
MPDNHPRIEQCFPVLSNFAKALGWNDLTPHHHGEDKWDIVWYTSGRDANNENAMFLQINESPNGNTSRFEAAVYALEYQLYTNWHLFPFPNSEAAMSEAISLTEALLHHKWFSDAEHRKRFSKQHTECTGFDWKRIRETKPRNVR